MIHDGIRIAEGEEYFRSEGLGEKICEILVGFDVRHDDLELLETSTRLVNEEMSPFDVPGAVRGRSRENW